ncbi:MAG: coproporphyrinogen III oxidase family protein [Gemmatales bacterium]|nr:coproporphyrinogen III oxidase family protein [Gemmatales bacterium]MDW8385640.1 coproporphyrinogen-III oxidase family protein [Gemmatales bacterium]
MTAIQDQEKTGLGNYFIANYPPFSFWKPEHVPAAEAALDRPPRPGTQLGLYLHIPFCRKRCKFCYFRVYTDKNARDVEDYLDALVKEVELYAARQAVRNRPLDFVYFGGGTPSYLSANQLTDLARRLKAIMPWDHAAEVTFECEPGTLQQHKLAALRELGITRLSLGVENFNDDILSENGRAHRSPEIYRAYQWAKDLRFPQINVDLIAGMVGETDENWRECVRKTIEMSPDSVTIYQMELPYNTIYSKELRVLGSNGVDPSQIADWPTKRRWVGYAFDELRKAGYEISSGYTMVKDKAKTRFVYRDGLWHGADLLGTGVASFGHVNGVHMQNVDDWDRYLARLNEGRLPLHRALPVSNRELLIRELVLQLKTGRVEPAYFHNKFGLDIIDLYAPVLERRQASGDLTYSAEEIKLTRQGLLQVDRLLPDFFLPEHRGVRYT